MVHSRSRWSRFSGGKVFVHFAGVTGCRPITPPTVFFVILCASYRRVSLRCQIFPLRNRGEKDLPRAGARRATEAQKSAAGGARAYRDGRGRNSRTPAGVRLFCAVWGRGACILKGLRRASWKRQNHAAQRKKPPYITIVEHCFLFREEAV